MAARMLARSSAGGPPRIQPRLREGPATLVATMMRSRCWRFSQRPTMLSETPKVSARGGTAYISAVSRKLTPAGQRVVELAVGIGFAGLLAEGHGAEADVGNDQLAATERAGIEIFGHGCLRKLVVFQGRPQSTP